MVNMDETHPIRVALFWDSKYAKDVLGPYFTKVAKKTCTFTQMMVFTEPSMLYPDVHEDDEDDDDADADYDVSSASDNKNDMDLGKQIDDLIESGTIRLLDWNDITRFTNEYTCLVHVIQNKHRNITSKFISELTSHLVVNDPEIPISSVIQEIQVLLQTGCTYKRACCGKWHEYTLSCSHTLSVCKDNGTRPDTYVSDIYSQKTYRQTYQSNFYPVVYEDFWRDAPYNLTFYPPNKNNQRCRKNGKRFRGEMDYRNPDSPPRCSRCRMPEHNRKTCNNQGSSYV
ncbi:hypothetical protein M9H77_17235 [Catharanthus roseus]|uniref:Uncharacterized protein n=1 Tax=Catharanthus roseus TaxID=4058 RepID=A0ACC0B414_CATRO|nr:hypothetical protein M9H77_17235 [Catharanthus roseus]